MCRIRGTDDHDLQRREGRGGDISAVCVEWGRTFHLNGIFNRDKGFPSKRSQTHFQSGRGGCQPGLFSFQRMQQKQRHLLVVHNGNLLNYCFFTLPLPTVQSKHYFISSWKGSILSGIFQPKSLLPMFQVENQSVIQSAGVAKVMTELKFVFVFSMLCHLQLQYNILLGNL